MTSPMTRHLTLDAQRAGYTVAGVEQLRSNRWLLHLVDPTGAVTIALVQARPLVGAADVQDLAELVRLRHSSLGILLALSGVFSPAAQRTLAELGDNRLRLCTSLPPAAQASMPEQHPLHASLNVAP